MAQPMIKLIVKQIQSGDSVVLRKRPVNGPPETKQVSLSFIIAPKLGRRAAGGKDETKEEFAAFEAREFLRTMLIGKEVLFKPTHKITLKSGEERESGFIYADTEKGDTGPSVNELIVEEGLAEVIRRKQNEDNAVYKRMIELEEAARANKKGKWAAGEITSSQRIVNQELNEKDAQSLLKRTFNDVVVEYVASADQLKVAIPLSNNVTQMVTLRLSGIRRSQNNSQYNEESLFFVESRVLQREVNVRIDASAGKSHNPILFGSVFYGENGQDLAIGLLREGMVELNEGTVKHCDPRVYREAENDAKTRRVRLFKNYQPQQSTKPDSNGQTAGPKTEFEARVVEVFLGDAVALQMPDNTTQKVFLAGIKPPKRETLKGQPAPPAGPQTNEQGERIRPLYDIPHMFEAREFLRKKLIGKRVQVHIEYKVEKRENFPEKTCVSITYNNQDIAELLLSKGLAKLVERPRENERPSNYDALMLASQKAENGREGMYSTEKKTGKRVNDLSNDGSKARQYLDHFSRGVTTRHSATVEHVYSSSRVKVYLPKDNCLINLILKGINAPKSTDQGTVGKEGLEYVKNNIFQRDVQVQISKDMDKVGNFIGYVYYETAPLVFKNISLSLVEEGLASVRDDQNTELLAAEEVAKSGHRGMWKDWVPEVEEDDDEEEEIDLTSDTVNNGDEKENSGTSTTATTGGDKNKKRADPKVKEDLEKRIKVVLTEVSYDSGAVNIYAQKCDQGAELEELMSELREDFTSNPPLSGAYTPKKQDVIAARFEADKQWYRAKILKIDTARKQAEVIFIDYGNRDTVPFKDLADLPSTKYSLNNFPPVAQLYGLAFLTVPSNDDDDIRDGCAYLNRWNGCELLLGQLYRESRQGAASEMVTLLDATTKQDIGLQALAAGFFGVKANARGRRDRLARVYESYIAAQDEAKKERRNLWRYGDNTEDNAREFGSLR